MAVKWLSLTLLTTVMILVSDLQVCNGCVEEERLSLLRIKSMFLSYNNNSIDHYSENYDDDPFVSWDGSNCCNWDRVQCDTSGTYVLGLLLDSLLPFHYHFRLEGNDYPLLNLSLFQNFKELKTLDLAYNGFTDFTENQGFNNFSSFNKLETLNLSVTHFGNKILSSLNGLNSLKTLRLSGNRLNGSMTLLGLKNLTLLDLSFNDWKVFPRLQGLRNLRELDLSSNEMQGFRGFSRLNKLEILNVEHNNFNNSIFSSLKGLISLKILSLGGNFGLCGIIPTEDIANLRGLEILDLSNHNYYDGAIPLQDLKNLKVLNLAHNQFNGSLPIQGFCEANNLIELKLRNNKIKGELSECVGNFTKLKVVDISYNEFSGKIPTTISKLTSMEYLSLEENDFEGTFSFSSLANHSNLRHFHLLGGNNIQVETEELHEWQPKFQLETLSMPSCNLNHQTASKFPTFLLSQHKLKYLDLSHNHLVGPFPFWLLHNNSALNSLDLRNNSLSGPLQLSTKNHTRLRHLQISSNNFSGQLPTHLGLLLPQVDHFDISKNSFQGNLPPSMKQMKMLCWLDASNNNFSGDLQISMFDNTFSLQFLLLANNFFSGNIEDAWKIKKYLLALDISNNMISGKIPTWIGSLEGLQYVQMSRNHFVGELPIQICSLFELTMLDVAQNQLVGEIPLTCFNSSSLVYLYMRKNEFSKPIRQGLLSSTASILKVIDLSYNNFSGYIPKWFNKFTSLRVLLLKGNELEGPIPTQLCQITKISIMDLSNNKLSGSIPSCFNNITFGDIKVNQTDNPNFSDLEVASDTSDVDTDNGCGNINIYSRICYMFNTYASTVQVEVDFTTKHRYESYKGNILNYMSGLDLSSNQLTGDIPLQIGDLVQIHALNLSYNKLVGNIPKVFSNLKQLESLDISNNLLSGHIPSELATLDYLSIFDVSYNNLSGMIPTAPHFTYPPSSFYGNPNLCGSYIEPKCSSPTLPRDNQLYEKLELEIDDGGLIDLEALFWSFAASYMILLLGFGAVLWINLQWRQRWFYFIEDCCYLFCKLT